MFYEEEEREADRIRAKYLVIKRRLQYQLRIKQGEGHVFADQDFCPKAGADTNLDKLNNESVA